MKGIQMFCCSILLLIKLVVSNQPYVANAVDLCDAYQIARAEAINWDEAALPYFITSVDDSMDGGFIQGADGKRRCWNFDFVVENTNKHFIITLHDKTIVNKIEADSSVHNDCIIETEKLNISTAEAVLVAKETYGLLPGTDWAQGYHFVLKREGRILVLAVVGRNESGEMSRVFFNAETGAVIG